MAWITIIWTVMATVAVLFAVGHVLACFRDESERAHLFLASLAASVALFVGFELAMMKSHETQRFGELMRWAHVPIFLLIVSIVGFVSVYLGTGRWWLAWAACGVRAVSLVINFLAGVNLNYARIGGVESIAYLGEPVTVVSAAEPSDWNRVAWLSLLLLLAFVVDASVTAYRRGQRRRALIVGGATSLVVLLASTHTALVHYGTLHTPYIIGIACFTLMLAMSYDLGLEALRASRLSRELQVARERAFYEERLRLAMEAMPIGVVMVNARGRVTLVNAQVETIFGYPRGELVGQPIEMLVPLNHRDAHPGHVAQYLADATARPMGAGRDLRGRHKNGSEIPVEIGLSPIVTAEGTYVLATIVNITLRRQTDMEITRQRNELAHLSRVSVMGELSGSLAHELNQPLASILSNAQAGQRMLPTDRPELKEVGEILDDVVSESKRAGEVIRRLRTLLTKGDMQRQPTAVNEVVLEVLKLLHGDLVTHGVTVGLKLQEDLPQISGDRVQLQQVLINLIVNAGDAMEGLAVNDRRILITTDSEDGASVRVSICDQGRGIAEENLTRIFEPFFTSKPRGMGLGLTVCRSIITAHGGKIWAERNGGRGTIVRFTLPVTKGDPA